MTYRRTLIGALALSTALAVSACAAATAYTTPANSDAYNLECYYDLTDECAPYVYGPPVIFGSGDLHHFNHFHDHPMQVVHGLGAFGGQGFGGHGFVSHGFAGHGFASHGGFGFGGHGGVGRG
jgi:hypothetical protein